MTEKRILRPVLSRQARKFLEDIAPKQFKQIMLKILAMLEEPTPHDSEQLRGYDGRRVDCGEFRIVYRFDDDRLELLAIGKRNDDEGYRKLR